MDKFIKQYINDYKNPSKKEGFEFMKKASHDYKRELCLYLYGIELEEYLDIISVMQNRNKRLFSLEMLRREQIAKRKQNEEKRG